jgi:hypothetical protein
MLNDYLFETNKEKWIFFMINNETVIDQFFFEEKKKIYLKMWKKAKKLICIVKFVYDKIQLV